MPQNVVDSNSFSRILGVKRKALDQISLLLSSGFASLKKTRNDEDVLDEYRNRLASFHNGKWENGKELNPRFLCERGFRLVDAAKKTIKCDACGFYLSTSLPDITTVDMKVYNRCLRKVFEGVETCHEKTCTAKSRRPNFFPHVNGEVELMRELSIRMDNMKNVHLSKEMEITEDSVDSDVLLRLFPDESVDIRLKRLVITGWEIEDSSNVRCPLCLRSISLDVSFIPSSSHYSWCPSIDLNDALDIPQWRVVIDMLSKSCRDLHECLSIARRALSASLSTSSLCDPTDIK